MAVWNIEPTSIQEVWEWKTDILTTIQGDESRLSIRNKPRIALNLGFEVMDDAKKRELNLTIAQNIKSTFESPLWPFASPITQTTTSGNARVYFENSRVPVTNTGVLILYNPRTGTAYQDDVTIVQTDGATLASNVTEDITTEWLAILGFQGVISDNSGFTLLPKGASLELEMQAYVNPDVQRPGTAASLNTLDSITILERKFADGATDKWEYPRETVDFEAGVRADYSQWLHARVNGTRAFLTQRLLDPTDYDYWRLFLDTVKGAWKPFLLSTQSPDMTLSTSLVANGSSMSINENLNADFLTYNSWKYIEIVYSDGSSSQHQVTSVTGSGPYTVNLSPNLPNDAKVANVSRISHLLKCRMADTIRFTHGPTVTAISFDVTTTDYG